MFKGVKARAVAGSIGLLAIAGAAWAAVENAPAEAALRLTKIGEYRTGAFDKGAAEIPAYDPGSRRLYVVNGASASIDVVDLSDPSRPRPLPSLDMKPYGKAANSVAVFGGVVAAAVEAAPKQSPGKAVFFDRDGKFLSSVTVGDLPDMIVFTPDGKHVLVANEGEPSDDYKIDPEGSVSIIDLGSGAANLTAANVRTVNFASWNGKALPDGMRSFGPGASTAQDLEPEYIAVSADSRTAWVTLQENNAIAEIDIARGELRKIWGLGFKDHRSHGMDASDKDKRIAINSWPVMGMYLPDAIAVLEEQGRTWLLTANEGDSRDYEGFSEETRVAKLKLDERAFPNAKALQADSALGRLKVTKTMGDSNGDGLYETLYSFGGRSFSVWSVDGKLVFDSGDEFEQILAELEPKNFNSANDENGSLDSRSDDKGPEPEGIAVGRVNERPYAFIGLERMSGIMVYDLANPARPRFVTYHSSRDFSGDPKKDTAGDLGPEGLLFIPAEQSPNGAPLLVAANEVSGSTSIYRIDPGR